MNIYVKQLYDEKGEKIPIALPTKGSEVAAGYDIEATSDPKIVGKQTTDEAWEKIDYIEYETNLFIAPSAVTFHTLIHPRSSISKYNLVLANSIGLIDNDYRGMVICRFKYVWQPEDLWWGGGIIQAGSDQIQKKIFGKPNMEKIYKKGDKIAQLVAEPTVQIQWEFVDDLSQTKRGTGGFGSTDKRGKPLPEVLSEEAKKFEASKKAAVTPSILDKYTLSGGVQVPKPYSDQIKQRDQ